MTTRTDIINHLISITNAQAYLEIGSGHHICFKDINCPLKHDIEPNPSPQIDPTYKMTSDEAFEIMRDAKYDIIFIDGIHHCDQTAKDVFNACIHLNPKGFIIIHDCLPEKEHEQHREAQASSWTGDVWKFQAWLVRHFENVWTIPENWGCGIIWKPIKFFVPSLKELQSFDWATYEKSWPWLLRVVNWEIFKKIIPLHLKEG